jgi:putative salt-induced outer membrane protein
MFEPIFKGLLDIMKGIGPMKFNRLLASTLTVFFFPLLTTSATAQEPIQGLMETKAASDGKTDVAKSGFEAATDRTEESKDTTELKLSLGGLLSSGNARLMSLTGAGRFKLRRDANQLSVAAAGNYARSALDEDESMETTLENIQGRARYDRFFSEVLTGFLAVSGTRDRFQGLDLRLNVDPGIALYVIDRKGHQLWVEAGYDLQYDIRRDDLIDAAELDGEKVDKTQARHNARGFLGYDNTLNERVTFNTGVEYLQDVQETKNWRVTWDAGLSSSISNAFSVATTFTLKYDNNPLPSVKNTDVITAVNIVYTLI